MSVDYKVRQIYNEVIKEVTKTPEAWQSVLRLAGQIYRYEFDNVLMVYAQKPHATLVADFDTWKLVGRYVKRGSKGIAIYPSQALKPYMRYVFDISDTGGKQSQLTWNLEGKNAKDFMEYQMYHGRYESSKEAEKEDVLIALKTFTKQEIDAIIKEEFEDRMTELSQITGSVIREFSEKREGLQHVTDLAEIARKSILYVVGTRCGFDLSGEEQDFRQIVNVKDEDTIYRLGSLICDVSCNVLRAYGKDCKVLESERRIAYGSRIGVQRSGRDIVSGVGDSGRNGEFGEVRQVWTSGDELPEGERTGEVQESSSNGTNDREDVGSGRRSQPDDGTASERLSEKEQTTESKLYDGDVENPQSGKDDGGGNRTEGTGDEIPLKEIDEELNRELDEINSLGMSKEAGEYVQASFFDAEYGLVDTSKKAQPQTNEYMQRFQKEAEDAKNGVHNYLNPKKATVVPHEYIKTVLLRGSGFANGRTRICKIFETEIDAGTRAGLIKKEYGTGGAGWPLEGLGLHGYDTFKGRGIRFQWRDEDGEVEGYVSWKDVEKEIAVLIMTGEYQPEIPRLDELASDGMREDELILDAEYREVDATENEQEEVLDEFAIPDEPESYASARKPSVDTDLLAQDEAELEKAYEEQLAIMEEEPKTERAPGELQYIEPIDYAKVIADMDEDLREAMEILVSECSCYTPFKPFLMDIVASENLFILNRWEIWLSFLL